MFTLQILDRGQTFLHPVTDRAVVLGSSPAADVVLGEDGVAAHHARIEPHARGARLEALAPVAVNGTPLAGLHELTLGDRIELGRAVVVVGRAVSRAASPDDVLADAPRRRQARPPARRGRALPALAAVVLAAVVVWLVASGDDAAHVQQQLAVVHRLRHEGQLDDARAALDRLRRDWRDATDDRLARADAEHQALAAIDARIASLTAEVADPAGTRGYAEWSQELQRLEHDGGPDERVAARRVRASLAETLRQRPRRAGDGTAVAARAGDSPAGAPAATPAPVAATPPAQLPAAIPTPTNTPATAPGAGPAIAVASHVDPAEIDRLVAQGLFAQAITLLQAGLAGQADPAIAARLREREVQVRALAQTAMAQLVAQARRDVADGDARDAAKSLQAARHRFPPTQEFRALTDEIAACEALATNRPLPSPPPVVEPSRPVDEATRAGTLVALRAIMDSVRQAEERGEFAVAAQHLRAAAHAARDRDADFAGRLVLRADEAQLLASWHAAVTAALARGQKLQWQADGGSAALAGVDGPRLRLAGVEAAVTWLELPAAAITTLAEQLGVTGEPALGAAALLYRLGESAPAEALLARLVRAEPGSKAAADRVIARGRGEPVDARGYTLGKDGFVAARTVELAQQAAKLATRFESALRDPKARDELWAETLATGPDATDVLAMALRRERDRLITKLDTGTLRKQVDKLAAQRVVLDAARAHAKELIFDEQQYFYPYRPPAVTSDKFAQYSRVQADVDRRVATLRTAWNDERVKVRVPASLRAELDRLDWIVGKLAQVGDVDPAPLARIEWVRALPAGDSVGVREFCATLAERDQRTAWRRIDDYNRVVAKAATAAQRELLQVTNDYRAMFGHPPIAMVPELNDAAQGHADEMSKLGFFDHNSPTPGRKTPFDRMRLAGYPVGVSENIALVDGAQAAHVAWCHSSGHHRALLDAANREIGIGANGRHWVQNFGGGTVHRDHAAWAATTR